MRVNFCKETDVVFQFTLFHRNGCEKLQQCSQCVVTHFRGGCVGEGTAGGDFYIAVFGVFQNEGNAGLLLSLVSAGFQVFFCHAGKLCICFAWYNVQFGAGL